MWRKFKLFFSFSLKISPFPKSVFFESNLYLHPFQISWPSCSSEDILTSTHLDISILCTFSQICNVHLIYIRYQINIKPHARPSVMWLLINTYLFVELTVPSSGNQGPHLYLKLYLYLYLYLHLYLHLY